MSSLLLINPSYMKTYGSNQAGIANPVYPILSLATLAGAAKASGHRAKILDLSYRPYDPTAIEEVIRREKPDVVGITATTPLMNQLRDMTFLIKEISPSITIVGGGAHPSSLPEESMRESLLDAIAIAEGDQTIVEILDGKKLSDIDGVYWRNGSEIVANKKRNLIEYLDDLPMPAWEEYPIDEYRSRVTKIIAKNSPLTTVEFSRGCLFKCDFCGSKQTMGLGYRKKSPKRCAEELKYLWHLGYREVILTDDIFTSDNAWALQVCEEIIRSGVKMAWTCTNGIRVDSANPELFRAMRRAGCYRVHFGFESGNDEVLKAFGKGGKASLEQGNHAVTEARRAGLETWGMFMIGLSADSEDSIEDTIRFAAKVKVDIKKFGVTVPFPGTPMFNQARREDRMKTYDWDNYNVYNEAEPIYVHPKLSWEKIQQLYKKAYMEAYYKNVPYIARRLWRALKTGEFFWDIYFGIRFFWMLLTQAKPVEVEAYRYRSKWEPLNMKPSEIQEYDVPRASRSTWKKEPLIESAPAT